MEPEVTDCGARSQLADVTGNRLPPRRRAMEYTSPTLIIVILLYVNGLLVQTVDIDGWRRKGNLGVLLTIRLILVASKYCCLYLDEKRKDRYPSFK